MCQSAENEHAQPTRAILPYDVPFKKWKDRSPVSDRLDMFATFGAPWVPISSLAALIGFDIAPSSVSGSLVSACVSASSSALVGAMGFETLLPRSEPEISTVFFGGTCCSSKRAPWAVEQQFPMRDHCHRSSWPIYNHKARPRFWVFSGGRGREQVPREIFPARSSGLPAAEFDLTWPPMARIYGSSYSTSTCEVRRLAD